MGGYSADAHQRYLEAPYERAAREEALLEDWYDRRRGEMVDALLQEIVWDWPYDVLKALFEDTDAGPQKWMAKVLDSLPFDQLREVAAHLKMPDPLEDSGGR